MRHVVWLLLLMTIACGTLDSGLNTLADVEAFIGEPLPASADGVEFEGGGFQDPFVLLRFEASAEDAAAYLAALDMARSDGPATWGAPEPNSIRAWDPDQADTAYTWDGGNAYRHALVDTSDSQRWIVYMFVFLT